MKWHHVLLRENSVAFQIYYDGDRGGAGKQSARHFHSSPEGTIHYFGH